jgi:hypothetical protein
MLNATGNVQIEGVFRYRIEAGRGVSRGVGGGFGQAAGSLGPASTGLGRDAGAGKAIADGGHWTVAGFSKWKGCVKAARNWRTDSSTLNSERGDLRERAGRTKQSVAAQN